MGELEYLVRIVAACCLLALPASADEGSGELAGRYWPQWRGPLGTGVAPHAHPPVEWSEDRISAGNSAAALNLLRLGRITGRSGLEAKSEEIVKAFAGDVRQNPSAYTQLLSAVDFGVGPSYELVIAGTHGVGDTSSMLRALRAYFAPNKVVLFRPDGEPAPAIARLAEFTANHKSLGGKATAYVCLN